MTIYEDILKKFDEIDPIKYGKTRNFIDGAVTNLSPYISRGVIDTTMVLEHMVNKGFTYFQLEKFIQQLAWREYFQRVWQMKGDQINIDIKQDQGAKMNSGMPLAINMGQTGIHAIDNGINHLKSHGNMHNHLRMYTAFLTCNLASCHWKDPARWMYYHLLDGDWASNALSWQWVAGTFSSKKYIANQENINHYTRTVQQSGYLNCSYEELSTMDTPDVLQEMIDPVLETMLPEKKEIHLNKDLPVLIYNYYNLSPNWRSDEKANRVLLLEPEIFEKYPVSTKCINLTLELSKNINAIMVFTGNFNELKKLAGDSLIIYREHPLNRHYVGHQDERPWMIAIDHHPTGSFFSFWKKAEKVIVKKYFGK